MTIAYDPRTQTIRVNHTEAEYLEAVGPDSLLGIPLYGGVADNLDDRIVFRHEYAHFTSFQMTGLSELHAAFHDYRIFVIAQYLRARLREHAKDETIRVPLIPLRRDTGDELSSALQAVIDLLNAQEALFFGLGTDRTADELFNWGVHERFYELLRLPVPMVFNPNIARYKRLLKQLRYTVAPELAVTPQATSVLWEDKQGRRRRLSSFSIQEAYAITIEVVARYIVGVRTSLNTRKQLSPRIPPLVNLSALNFMFEELFKDLEFDVERYLRNGYAVDVYWAIAMTSFAAMQVPVLEDIEGDLVAMGTVKQLCPAHRLVHLLHAITSGSVKHPQETYQRSERELLQWFEAAQRSVGDPWSAKLYANIVDLVTSVPQHFDHKEQTRSMHVMAWAARAKFWLFPQDSIWECGLWSPPTPLQIWYVATSDNGLLSAIRPGHEPGVKSEQYVWFRYIADSASQIIEAITFEEAWSSIWPGLSPIADDRARLQAIKVVLLKYGVFDETESPPPILIRDGFESAQPPAV